MPKICHILLLGSLCCGCSTWHGKSGEYRTTYDRVFQVSSFAVTQNEKAIKRFQNGDPCGAEKLLKEVLAKDDNFGPAHNTLGNVYFAQQKYYPAACEYDRAAKLMPERPEPLNNLGMIYEIVGRLDESIAMFEEAVAVDTVNPEYLGNLIRARLRRGDDPLELAELLRTLVLIDDRPNWVAWAKERLHTGPIGRVNFADCPVMIELSDIDDEPSFVPMTDTEDLAPPAPMESPSEKLPSPPVNRPSQPDDRPN